MKDVENWLVQNNLSELVNRFENEKINSMRRIQVLTGDLVRELIPEVGLRADFENCLLSLKNNNASNKISTQNSTDAESLALSDENFLVTINNSQFIDEEGSSLSVLQVTSCEESNQKKKSTAKNAKIRSFKSSKAVRLISDTDSEEEYSVSNKKKSRLKSNCVTNKHLNSLKSFARLKEVDLEIYLRNYDLRSETAVDNYKLKGALNERDRSSIMNAIAHEMLRVNYMPCHFEYLEIVKKICTLFPSEDPSIYYIPPDNAHRNAQGKLPNKIKNIKYSLRKKDDTILHFPPSSVQCISQVLGKPKIIEPTQLKGSINKKDHAVQTAITYLKHESRDSWPQLLVNWSITHAFRRKNLLETRPKIQSETNKTKKKHCDDSENSESEDEEQFVDEYIQKWNVLNLSNGYLLLNQDFKELFPDNEDGLFSKWETAKELIINLAETEIPVSDIYGRDLLKQYHAVSADKRDVITLFLLPSLCCKRGRGKIIGYIPSVQEARKFFILHVTIPGDLNRAVKNHRVHLNATGTRLQPILIVVGQTLANITAAYIQIDNIRYKLRTSIAALDACLKAYHALDAVYPSECKAVWYFVQHYFYNLYLKEDENICRVASLISSLRGFASKK